MTGTLHSRVSAFVAACPGCTLEEIARAVTARTADVRDVLSGDEFSASLRAAHPADRAQVYRAARRAQDGPGRVRTARTPSQCDRLLTIMRDGNWHCSADLHRAVFCILHSRVAELNRQGLRYGYRIEHRGGGPGADHHWYRLVTFGVSEAAA